MAGSRLWLFTASGQGSLPTGIHRMPSVAAWLNCVQPHWRLQFHGPGRGQVRRRSARARSLESQLRAKTGPAAGDGREVVPRVASPDRPQVPPQAGRVGWPCQHPNRVTCARYGPRRHPPAAPDRPDYATSGSAAGSTAIAVPDDAPLIIMEALFAASCRDFVDRCA